VPVTTGSSSAAVEPDDDAREVGWAIKRDREVEPKKPVAEPRIGEVLAEFIDLPGANADLAEIGEDGVIAQADCLGEDPSAETGRCRIIDRAA